MLTATTFLLALLLMLVAREVYLALWLHRSTRIQCSRQGWVATEIRRRVAMEEVPVHVSAYPLPREERILVSRVLGLVIWHREVSVGLPASACERLSAIAPQEFDQQFPPWLRLGVVQI